MVYVYAVFLTSHDIARMNAALKNGR